MSNAVNDWGKWRTLYFPPLVNNRGNKFEQWIKDNESHFRVNDFESKKTSVNIRSVAWKQRKIQQPN